MYLRKKVGKITNSEGEAFVYSSSVTFLVVILAGKISV